MAKLKPLQLFSSIDCGLKHTDSGFINELCWLFNLRFIYLFLYKSYKERRKRDRNRENPLFAGSPSKWLQKPTTRWSKARSLELHSVITCDYRGQGLGPSLDALPGTLPGS